jgi:hypothetical protein
MTPYYLPDENLVRSRLKAGGRAYPLKYLCDFNIYGGAPNAAFCPRIKRAHFPFMLHREINNGPELRKFIEGK